MTPLSETSLELRLFIDRAEKARAATTLSDDDFRSEQIGELVDVLDRVDPTWGTRLLLALYPRADVMWADRQLRQHGDLAA